MHQRLTVSAAVLVCPVVVLGVAAHGRAVVSAVGDRVSRARGGHCRTDRLV